ncbi:MAG: helix-turn-helix transcriptional regulator [Bacilli bacterium]|nr:helix-turn-helix transcriptional regulator [Bacilli bacterium]
MKKISKIAEIYNNKELKEMSIEQQEKWLRAKIVMQFVYLREKQGYTQQEIADKMGVMRQQITRFENMSNSPTIFFLVKYANALDTELDVVLKGIELIGVTNNEQI